MDRIGDAGTTSVKTYDTVEKAQAQATKAINFFLSDESYQVWLSNPNIRIDREVLLYYEY